MEMNSERRLVASRQAVWAALNDADVLKQCIPGCESLEKLWGRLGTLEDDRTW